MTFEPMLQAGLAIQIHTAAAISAFALGAFQLWKPKGGPSHRALGWSWVVLMAIVAASGFFIHQIDAWNGWSPIHLLSILVLIQLPLAILMIRRGNVSAHKRIMTGMFAGALVLAGFFTLMPSRVIGRMIFG